MKAAVFYLSRTGNTKRFAEAISESLKAPLFEITSIEPESQTDYDLLIIGTPVMGGAACPEVVSFVKRLPNGVNKKAIVFCTYAVAKGGTLKSLKQRLLEKGYTKVLMVSKKGIRPKKEDFADALNEIKACVGQLGLIIDDQNGTGEK